MATTTLEQPASKWSSRLCLDRPYLELVWGAWTLYRRSSWIIPALGIKKKGPHKGTVPPLGSQGISQSVQWGQLADNFNMKRHDASAIKMFEIICWFTTQVSGQGYTVEHPTQTLQVRRKWKLVDKNLFTRHRKPLMTSQNSLEAEALKMLSHTPFFYFQIKGSFSPWNRSLFLLWLASTSRKFFIFLISVLA